jgi:hypothetical protein
MEAKGVLKTVETFIHSSFRLQECFRGWQVVGQLQKAGKPSVVHHEMILLLCLHQECYFAMHGATRASIHAIMTLSA